MPSFETKESIILEMIQLLGSAMRPTQIMTDDDFGVSGNLFVIVVIARTPVLQTSMYQFVTWLAASDVATGLSILLRIPQVLGYLDNFYLCLFRYYTINTCGIMSGLACLGKIEKNSDFYFNRERMNIYLARCNLVAKANETSFFNECII